MGSVFVTALWKLGLRETPGLTRKQLLGLLPIGTFHAIGHAAGTLRTGLTLTLTLTLPIPNPNPNPNPP